MTGSVINVINSFIIVFMSAIESFMLVFMAPIENMDVKF